MDKLKEVHLKLGVFNAFKMGYQLYTDDTDDRLNRYKDSFEEMESPINVIKDRENKILTLSIGIKKFHLHMEDDHNTPINFQVEEDNEIVLDYSLEELLEYTDKISTL